MTLRASWVAAAALTVLASGAATARTAGTAAAPGPTPAPAAAPASAPVAVSWVAADLAPPRPVALSLPVAAPPTPAPARPAPAAAVPAPARPADRTCTGDGWQQRRVDAAVQRLRRPADARAVRVDVRLARPDVLGLAHLDEGRLELFVRSCARQSDALLLHVLAHELGHLRDASRLTDAQRAEWMRLRGIPAGTPWFGCDGCTDFATPAGDFAEVYAQWQRAARSNRSELAGAPSPAELQQLAARFF